ncbi:MAG: lipopolysaccharide biosynthesis protein [Chloroflexi bacterium]|nr:lipopolysaccharide biosynthesis protein [Chloroflexota bacterium]
MKLPAASGAGAPRDEDSLRKRYGYKLGANFMGLPVTLGIQAVMARMLGPANYGSYSFLNSFFVQIVNFFDSGISAGFYTKLSQRPDEPGLVRFFWVVAVTVSALFIVSVAITIGLGARETVWPDQRAIYICMAAIWALLIWYSQVINKTLDAYGLTAQGEIVRLGQKVLALVLILLMFWLGWGSLGQFYLYQYVVLSFLCVSWAVVLRRHGRTLFPAQPLATGRIGDYGREFYIYSAPLVVLNVVDLVAAILDRWFLQRFSGSVQQGLFGLSAQVGALCFLVSGAMTPLFWREISRAFGAGDDDAMRRLFGRTVRILYVVTACLSGLIAFQARNVSLLLGGADFSAAALPIAIMVFYPVHQTYGQLTGSFMLATGQTQLARNLGIVTILFGLGLSYYLLAPPVLGGLGLGAVGLAFKMVMAQLVAVNLQLWFITRFLGVSFRSFLWHQLYALASIMLVAWVSTWVAGRVVSGPLPELLCSGVVYALGLGMLVFAFPALVSMSRADLAREIAAARSALAR